MRLFRLALVCDEFVAYTSCMSKRVIDLTAEELDRLAGDAWFEASKAALQAGAPVVGRDGSKIVKTYPDGRREILGEATDLVELDPAASEKREPTRSKRARHTNTSSKTRRTG